MATLRDIKNRINGVQNTQKITNAMKMVAAAKLRRAQENVINARPYTNEISRMLSHLVTEGELPPDFQSSEFFLNHGFLDAIVNRKELKKSIVSLLDYMQLAN